MCRWLRAERVRGGRRAGPAHVYWLGPGEWRAGGRRAAVYRRGGVVGGGERRARPWCRREKLSLGPGACDEPVVCGGGEVTGRWAVPGRVWRGRRQKLKAVLPCSLELAGSRNPVDITVDALLS